MFIQNVKTINFNRKMTFVDLWAAPCGGHPGDFPGPRLVNSPRRFSEWPRIVLPGAERNLHQGSEPEWAMSFRCEARKGNMSALDRIRQGRAVEFFRRLLSAPAKPSCRLRVSALELELEAQPGPSQGPRKK